MKLFSYTLTAFTSCIPRQLGHGPHPFCLFPFRFFQFRLRRFSFFTLGTTRLRPVTTRLHFVTTRLRPVATRFPLGTTWRRLVAGVHRSGFFEGGRCSLIFVLRRRWRRLLRFVFEDFAGGRCSLIFVLRRRRRRLLRFVFEDFGHDVISFL